MALSGFPFPYDINNLLGGAVRIQFAVADGGTPVAVPTNQADMFAMVSPYAAQTGWVDLGATSEAFTYSRGFETEGWEIQQTAGNVIEEITGLSRTIEIPFAEFKPEHLAMIEGAPSTNITTIAAAAGKSSQKKITFGSFKSLNRYRFAFTSQRSIQSGVVTEPGAVTRGRFFTGVLFSAQIAADEVSFDQEKGTLTGVGVTFTAFPESGQPAGQEWGAWYDEQSGTIAAA